MMAWETQGPVTNRTQEHLGASDEGIILFRKLLREQIEVVQKGGEPLGVVRDPEKNRIIHFNVINERRGIRAAS
jgi:5,5'-dehydrodivanillate O-demethylase